MYSSQIVRTLLAQQKKNQSDLAEFIYGERNHTVRTLLADDANPTAKHVELIAQFFNVPIDFLFGRNVLNEDMKKNLELMEKLCRSQENTIEIQKEQIALLNAKIKLLEETDKALDEMSSRERAYARKVSQK